MSVLAHAWAKTVKTGSPTLKAVLVAIADYANAEGHAWPSQEQLAEDTEFSLRAVRNAIAGLEALGLLVRTERRRRDGSRQSDSLTLRMGTPPNRHVVPGEQPAPRSDQPARRSNQPAPDDSQAARRAGLTSFEPSENHQRNRQSSEETCAWPVDFREQFRDAYPHWVKGPVAFAELDRLHREGDVPFSAILDGIALYVASKPPDRNWMGPDRFLADRRFEDRPAPIAPRLVRSDGAPLPRQPTGRAKRQAELMAEIEEEMRSDPGSDDHIIVLDDYPAGSRGEDRGVSWSSGTDRRPSDPLLRATRLGAFDPRAAAALRRAKPA